ncbi:MAG: transposase [Treponema sp.]|nr:transposase [Candidatus Treponema equifaecale]
MSKYSEAFKLKIVNEHIEKKYGAYYLANKYNIPRTTVKEWIMQYDAFGHFIPPIQHYTTEFKLKVLNYQQENKLSDSQIMIEFRLPHRTLVKSWRKAYLEGGLSKISSPKGRPLKMPKSVIPDKPREEWTKDEELAALKAENLYLKKLWALIQQENEQKKAKEKENSELSEN